MNPETHSPKTPEHGRLPEGERSQERIKESIEKAAENHEDNKQQRMEKARSEIKQHAVEKSGMQLEKDSTRPSSVPLKTKDIQEEKYQETLHDIQQKMDRPQRTFSKVVHSKFIERTSEVAEKTIMRPNILLGAAAGGFIGLLLFYFVAKRYGYELSGFEYFAFALIGAIFAGLFEIARSFIQQIRLRD